MNNTIKPMLCKLATRPFNSPSQVWERKYDGVRILAYCDPDIPVLLMSRSGKDKTTMFPDIQPSVATPCILDGEMVSMDESLNFQEFSQRRGNRSYGIESIALELPAKYIVFDIVNEHMQLVDRHKLLCETLVETDNVQIATQYQDGIALFEVAKENAWEGIVGKDTHSVYEQGKRRWLKVKVWQEDEFWINGWTTGEGKRADLPGALCLSNDDGVEVGQVGTGFSNHELLRVLNNLLIRTDFSVDYHIHNKWLVEKGLRAKIKYIEVTNDGKLRFPVYLGILE